MVSKTPVPIITATGPIIRNHGQRCLYHGAVCCGKLGLVACMSFSLLMSRFHFGTMKAAPSLTLRSGSVSERTVNYHVQNLIVKLGACNKMSAVTKATKAGII